MARRRKTYFAKKNKGEAIGVFFNNCLAESEKNRKREEKEKVTSEKAAIRREKQASARWKKEALQKQKENEKFNKLLDRVEFTCSKYQINKIVASEVAQKCLDLGFTISTFEREYFKVKIDEIKKRAEELEVIEELDEIESKNYLLEEDFEKFSEEMLSNYPYAKNIVTNENFVKLKNFRLKHIDELDEKINKFMRDDK